MLKNNYSDVKCGREDIIFDDGNYIPHSKLKEISIYQIVRNSMEKCETEPFTIDYDIEFLDDEGTSKRNVHLKLLHDILFFLYNF